MPPTSATGQRLYLHNTDTTTTLTLVASAAGQQQAQRSGLSTGPWQKPPTVFRTAGSIIVRIEAQGGEFFVQVQGSSMHVLSSSPSLGTAEVLPTQRSSEATVPGGMQPMQPMQPMQMQMGDMQMQMEPMKMQMGDMQMQMPPMQQATPASAAPKPSRRFCPQCGTPVKPTDRFCSSCGHRLVEADSE
ncbi:MAG: zinc ribbon domain-containing protein [Chloroflexaceae bacterium]|nr:zinc ribbon domain-containing protein [Chloroflexaceae bacterium]